jgi:hypothetical protein
MLSAALPEEIASLHAAANGGPVAAAASTLLFHEFENLDPTLAEAGADRALRWGSRFGGGSILEARAAKFVAHASL